MESTGEEGRIQVLETKDEKENKKRGEFRGGWKKIKKEKEGFRC